MAEERTLGLSRAHDQPSEDLSKEELQRRLDEARGSIANTVTEIKETVANQVQAVKDTLDWREQFKKRPVAWSAGAVGVGFLVGYGVAALVKGDGSDDELVFQTGESRNASYSARAAASPASMQPQAHGNGHDEDKGPGLFQRLTETPAYEKVKNEAGTVAETLLKELSNTAKTVVVPALIKSVKDFLGSHLPGGESGIGNRQRSQETSNAAQNPGQPRSAAGSYEPVLERNQG